MISWSKEVEKAMWGDEAVLPPPCPRTTAFRGRYEQCGGEKWTAHRATLTVWGTFDLVQLTGDKTQASKRASRHHGRAGTNAQSR